MSSVSSSSSSSSSIGVNESVWIRSVVWEGKGLDGHLILIDQRKLPAEFTRVTLTTVEQVCSGIKDMTVRGAPAIGVAGAYGIVIAAIASKATSSSALIADIAAAKVELDKSRPTAVNLVWATSRMNDVATQLDHANHSIDNIRQCLLKEANELAEDDVRINKRIGNFGASVVPDGANIIHHCNTGRLATVDYGTALGVIYSAHEQKKNIHVWVDETRPRLQGAKLTTWELQRAGVPFHLVVDGASGLLMYNKKVDVAVFGADRVARNGDTANKIGTFNLAIVAREHGVPVYACVPTSTIDINITSGHDIPIEERASSEVTEVAIPTDSSTTTPSTTTGGSVRLAPSDVRVYNPSFDVTPAKYITGIITEEGICYPPFNVSLPKAKASAESKLNLERQARLAHYLNPVSIT